MRVQAVLLLDIIGIKRIVVVDDEYAAVTVEDLIGLCSDLDMETAGRLPHLQGIAFNSDQDIWASQLRAQWENLDPKQKSEVIEQARKSQVAASKDVGSSQTDDDAGGQPAENAVEPTGGAGGGLEAVCLTGDPRRNPVNDVRAADVLEHTLRDLCGHEFVTLSLAQWWHQSEKLLQSPDASSTLFLFDRDFRREGKSADEGLSLVQAVLARAVGYCGLLTHTVSINGEYQAWQELSAEHALDRDRFVVIAKARLAATPPDPYSFLRMLRLAALSGRCADIKKKAWQVFEDSLSEARSQMERLSVLDFDQIVLASSLREGVWEPDTLFRVFSLLMRREARERLHNDAKLSEAVATARRVSRLPAEARELFGAEQGCLGALGIQRFEAYETGEFLNRYHQPIDLGDMFEDNDGRRYLVLAQPCDLMVRSTGGLRGKRSYDNKDRRCVPLVEINTDVPQGADAKSRFVILPYYDEATGRPAYADLAKVHHVRLAVLDLCAFHADGLATIDLEAACPDVLLEPLKYRYEILRALFGRARDSHDGVRRRGFTAAEALAMVPQASTTERFRASVDNAVVRYGVKRVLRLRQPRAGAVLSAFALYYSRPAFEHDLMEQVREPEPPDEASDASDSTVVVPAGGSFPGEGAC